MKDLLTKLPVWLIAAVVLVFLGIVLEQLYVRKAPVDLWGLNLNQPPKKVDALTVVVGKGPNAYGDGENSYREATCPSGSTLVGGGCFCGHSISTSASYPDTRKSNVWYCRCDGIQKSNTHQVAYAMCLRPE